MNRWVLNYYYNSVYLELLSQYYSTPIKNSTRGPEEPQELSYTKSLKILNPKRYRACKERPNRSINYGKMVEKL